VPFPLGIDRIYIYLASPDTAPPGVGFFIPPSHVVVVVSLIYLNGFSVFKMKTDAIKKRENHH
jgi:hypothetical protein